MTRRAGAHTSHLTVEQRQRVRTLFFEGGKHKEDIRQITGYTQNQIKYAIAAESAQVKPRSGRPVLAEGNQSPNTRKRQRPPRATTSTTTTTTTAATRSRALSPNSRVADETPRDRVESRPTPTTGAGPIPGHDGPAHENPSFLTPPFDSQGSTQTTFSCPGLLSLPSHQPWFPPTCNPPAMSLPETYDDLPDKRRYWPATPGSREEGLGMLRLLTPDVVAAAAQSEIKTGERVCLNWDLRKLDPPGFGRQPFKHSIHWVDQGIAFDDVYHMNPQQSSQWDGLRHHSAPHPSGQMLFHGGTTPAEIQDPSCSRIGIGHWGREGIAGRGVLIDYVSYAEKRGIPINGLSAQVVSLDEVREIARECNISFRKGDIFFMRVGLTKTWDRMTSEQKAVYSAQKTPIHAGIEQSERVVRFLWDNHFAAVAGDAVSFEVFPPLNPEWDLHHHLLAGYGIPIGEMFDLEGLSELCKKHKRWSFSVSSSPLNVAQGVSSPPNCMAIF